MLRCAVLSSVALAMLVLAAPAHAQENSRQLVREVDRVRDATLDDFSDGVRAAAEAAGLQAPSDAEIRQEFRAADTNGDGTLSAAEQANNTPRNCSGRGVCHMGRCFCVAGLVEDPEVNSASQENPVFHEASGPSSNPIRD